jgi:hypothetical protein
MTAHGQFQGDRARTPEDEKFLNAFATGVARWPLTHPKLDSFRVFAGIKPLVLVLDVPGVDVSPGTCTLQIAYWHDGPNGRMLEGEWGDNHLLDNHDYNADGLTIIGLEEAPDTYGQFAANWMERQLERPVERLDWLQAGQVRESTWRLADSGKSIARRGTSLRLPSKPPDRKLNIR